MTSMALLWAASMGVAAAIAGGPLRDALERGILAHALDSRVESARPARGSGPHVGYPASSNDSSTE